MTKRVRVSRAALLAGLVTLTTAAAAGAATGTPAGGSIRVLDTSPGTGAGGGKVLVTGAIGDHGTTRTVNKSGKPESNGRYVKLVLTKGTFELNSITLNKNINRAFNSAPVNPATCSLGIAASGSLPISDGTGLYKGISGTIRITISIGLTLPRYTSGPRAGKCNESNAAAPTASLQLVTGSGVVAFH
jgi:hypothetical protein